MMVMLLMRMLRLEKYTGGVEFGVDAWKGIVHDLCACGVCLFCARLGYVMDFVIGMMPCGCCVVFYIILSWSLSFSFEVSVDARDREPLFSTIPAVFESSFRPASKAVDSNA